MPTFLMCKYTANIIGSLSFYNLQNKGLCYLQKKDSQNNRPLALTLTKSISYTENNIKRMFFNNIQKVAL